MKRSWKVAAATVAAVVLGVLVAFLVWNPSSTPGSASGRATGTSRAEARDSDAASAASEQGGASSESAVVSGSRIETTAASYFGRPFETIQIAGRYHGVHSPRTLRVQVRQADGWKQFPLPAVTRPSGEFRAYVELGPGRYRLRLVDPGRAQASRVVTVLVF